MMTQKEIDYEIKQVKAIWGIENMDMSPLFELNARAFLNKEISYEKFEELATEELKNELSSKSQEEQAQDIEELRLWQRTDAFVYFEMLQLTTRLQIAKTYDSVNRADRVCSQIRRMQLVDSPIQGKFDKNHFLAIHKHLLQDIYYFAGQVRDVPMQIDSVTRFVIPSKIHDRLDKFFTDLEKNNYFNGLSKEKFVIKMAHSLTDINILHPFREGNGRIKRVFFSDLAKQAGYKLDWSKCNSEEWKYSDEAAFDNYRDGVKDASMLEYCLSRAISQFEKT